MSVVSTARTNAWLCALAFLIFFGDGMFALRQSAAAGQCTSKELNEVKRLEKQFYIAGSKCNPKTCSSSCKRFRDSAYKIVRWVSTHPNCSRENPFHSVETGSVETGSFSYVLSIFIEVRDEKCGH